MFQVLRTKSCLKPYREDSFYQKTTYSCFPPAGFWVHLIKFSNKMHTDYNLLTYASIFPFPHTLPVKTAMTTCLHISSSIPSLPLIPSYWGNCFPNTILQSHMFRVFKVFPRAELFSPNWARSGQLNSYSWICMSSAHPTCCFVSLLYHVWYWDIWLYTHLYIKFPCWDPEKEVLPRVY